MSIGGVVVVLDRPNEEASLDDDHVAGFSSGAAVAVVVKSLQVGVVVVVVVLLLVVLDGDGLDDVRRVPAAEGADVVLERPLVLEVGAADAEPELAAVLLVRAPVAAHGEPLAAAAARRDARRACAGSASAACGSP